MKEAAYSEEEVRRWLGWLARGMEEDGQSVFLIERLQPDWLLTRGQRSAYILISRTFLNSAVTFVVTSVAAFLAATGVLDNLISRVTTIFVDLPIRPNSTFLSRAEFSVLLGLVLAYAEVVEKTGGEKSISRLKFFIGFVVVYYAVGFLLVLWLDWDYGPSGIVTVSAGAIPTLFISLFRARGELNSDTHPVERVTWSWERFAIALGAGGAVLHTWWEAVWSSNPLLIIGAFLAIPLVLVWLVFLYLPVCIHAAMESVNVEMKTVPNMGMQLSVRNAVVFLIPGLALLAASGMWNVLTPGDLGWFVLPLATSWFLFCLFLSATFGGIGFLDHVVVRVTMRACGYAPLDYPRFLDYAATELDFLQKVGGGYMFMHRHLLEYFAGQNDETVGEVGVKVAEQPV